MFFEKMIKRNNTFWNAKILSKIFLIFRENSQLSKNVFQKKIEKTKNFKKERTAQNLKKDKKCFEERKEKKEIKKMLC